MTIYPHEKDIPNFDGGPICSTAALSNSGDADSEKIAIAVKKFRDKYAKENAEKYLPKGVMDTYGVMASSIWNGNDDVFTREEISKARYTPIYKPVNEMHKFKEGSAKIIGVITSSMLVGENYEPIWSDSECDDDTKVSLLITASLWEIYFPKACAKIKTDIKDKKAFLSMECVSDDFGYALKAEGSDNIILLPRNELTSHLTKSLRAYQGKGTVKINDINYRIGRWLIGTNFTGVAYVDIPADPNAVVFEDYLSHATARLIPADDDFIQNVEKTNTAPDKLLKQPVNSVSYLMKKGKVAWL